MSSEEGAQRERRLVLDRNIAELERLAEFVRDVGHGQGLGEDQLFALGLCLEEAVANIIMHAGDADQTATRIVVTIRCAPSLLVASTEDDGPAFDPTVAATPAAPASLEQARIGGLGIHLIRRLSTGMRYQRVEGRNRLTFEFGPKAGNG